MRWKYIKNKKGVYRKILGYGTVSYSHREEDILINNMLKYAFYVSGKINYLDIGAGEPILYSNTYYFYKRGGNGVCVDPRKHIQQQFEKKRRNDIFLPVAISVKTETKNFYEFDLGLISTLNDNDKNIYENNGYKIKSTYSVQTIDINQILSKYFENKELHLLDIDIEGNEFEVIKQLDFTKFQPYVICIEVVDPLTDLHRENTLELVEYMKTKDYHIFVDTISNLIFFNQNKLKNKYYMK